MLPRVQRDWTLAELQRREPRILFFLHSSLPRCSPPSVSVSNFPARYTSVDSEFHEEVAGFEFSLPRWVAERQGGASLVQEVNVVRIFHLHGHAYVGNGGGS